MNRVVFSSLSDHWSTPEGIYTKLNDEFNFTFDPCPLNSIVDGTKISWHGRAFCNPPYSNIPAFMRRGLFHVRSGECEVAVFLVPSRTDTAWFHDYCLTSGEIRFIRGRLKFGGAKFNAPFPSMVVIFRSQPVTSQITATNK